MELTLGSETSTHFNQTPGIYPKENTLHQQHGESLKTRMCVACVVGKGTFFFFLLAALTDWYNTKYKVTGCIAFY
jgi:hypothetical protein